MKVARKQLKTRADSHSDHEDNEEVGDIKQPRINDKKEEESLEALKHKILGRSISSMYDIDHVSEAALSSTSKETLLNASTFADGTTVANHLRQELSCPICHNILYNPSSLLCGHSFCMTCLNWWLDRHQQQQHGQNHGMGRGMMDEDDGDSGGEFSSNWQGTCPSCREPIPPSINNNNGECSSKPNIQVNTALKAVLNTLYGTEMNQCRQAEQRKKMKAQSGEMGGIHTRGCEEIVPLADEKDELGFIRETLIIKEGDDGKRRNRYEDEENGWIALHSSLDQPGWHSNGGYSHGKSGSSSAMIRRNIVLDDSDQQYQLSLGLTKCSYSNSNSNSNMKYAAKANNSNDNDGIQYGVLDIELCLLAMEEDEVDDSGFPTFVNKGDDDEALICTENDRIHTCIEAAARVISLPEIQNVDKDGELKILSGANKGNGSALPQVRELSLSQGMIGRDGSVRFQIDLNKALKEGCGGNSADLHIVKLRFVHVDTSAMLELRLPSKIATKGKGGDDGEIEFCGTSKQTAVMNNASRYLLDDHDEDEEDEEEEEEEEVLHIPKKKKKKKKKKQQKRKFIDLSDSYDSDEEYAS